MVTKTYILNIFSIHICVSISRIIILHVYHVLIKKFILIVKIYMTNQLLYNLQQNESLSGYYYYSYINHYMVTSDTIQLTITIHVMYYITCITTLQLPHWDENLSGKVMFKHRGVDGGQGTCIPVHAHRFYPGKEKTYQLLLNTKIVRV